MIEFLWYQVLDFLSAQAAGVAALLLVGVSAAGVVALLVSLGWVAGYLARCRDERDRLSDDWIRDHDRRESQSSAGE